MNILITGGSGLIGSHLKQHLKEHNVSTLSRKSSADKNYIWDVERNYIDPLALQSAEVIIHLAGATIGKRWTAKHKKAIFESRVKSTEMLFEKLHTAKHNVHTIVCSSAVGIYGDTGENLVDESAEPGTGFLAEVCIAWETAMKKFETLGIRTIILRQGIVLDATDGALPEMMRPIKYFAGTPLGRGQQYIPWIHIDDLCRLYEFAISSSNIHGIYNAVASQVVTNSEFTQSIANTIHRPFWPVNVPASVLKLILGEMSSMLLEGQKVSNKKILADGFSFEYNSLNLALKNLLD